MSGWYRLNPPPDVGEPGATSEAVDDTIVTSFPDGTSRVDYPDRSVMVLFPDGAVLNIYPDGTRTFNDADGVALDPWTGGPLDALPSEPTGGTERLLEILGGYHDLTDLEEAQGYLELLGDTATGELSPVGWFTEVVGAGLHVLAALETRQRGCRRRGWCYASVYGALGMGAPDDPPFAPGHVDTDEDALDLAAWREGVAHAAAQLTAPGTEGPRFRNRVLMEIARLGADPRAAVQSLWDTACDHYPDGDGALKAAYAHLPWPAPYLT